MKQSRLSFTCCLIGLIALLGPGCGPKPWGYEYEFRARGDSASSNARDTAVVRYEGLTLFVKPSQTGFDIHAENDGLKTYYIVWELSRYIGIDGRQPLIVRLYPGDYELADRDPPSGIIYPNSTFHVTVLGGHHVFGLKDEETHVIEWREIGHAQLNDHANDMLREQIPLFKGRSFDLEIFLLGGDGSELKFYRLTFEIEAIKVNKP